MKRWKETSKERKQVAQKGEKFLKGLRSVMDCHEKVQVRVDEITKVSNFKKFLV
jgi:predicted RNA-binding protein Jag